jgi:hypothetical protein
MDVYDPVLRFRGCPAAAISMTIVSAMILSCLSFYDIRRWLGDIDLVTLQDVVAAVLYSLDGMRDRKRAAGAGNVIWE